MLCLKKRNLLYPVGLACKLFLLDLRAYFKGLSFLSLLFTFYLTLFFIWSIFLSTFRQYDNVLSDASDSFFKIHP